MRDSVQTGTTSTDLAALHTPNTPRLSLLSIAGGLCHVARARNAAAPSGELKISQLRSGALKFSVNPSASALPSGCHE